MSRNNFVEAFEVERQRSHSDHKRIKVCPKCGKPVLSVEHYRNGARFYLHTIAEPIPFGPVPFRKTTGCTVYPDEVT